MGNHAVRVSLEDLLVANGKRSNTPNYRKNPESTIITNSHQHSINRTLSSNDAILNTTTYSYYNTENKLVFSRPGPGLVNISLGDEEENYYIPKGGRDAFFYAYTYLRGQSSDNICDANAGNNIDYLKLNI